ncbi:hypothetical protein ACS0TY_004742 [Phlomoides rotata]
MKEYMDSILCQSDSGITADPMSLENFEKGVSKRIRENGEEPEEKGEKRAKIEDEKSAEEQLMEGEGEKQKNE